MTSFGNRTFLQTLAATLAENELFDGEGDIFSQEGDDGGRRYQAVFKARFDDMVNLVVTLPTATTNIYLTVTEGDPALVRRVLAAIEDQEREVAVNLGNVLLLSDRQLDERAICGVLFLFPHTFNCLDVLPGGLHVDGVDYRFLSVVFLTIDEHRIWKEQGHDVLMDHWTETEHDLIRFGADPPGRA